MDESKKVCSGCRVIKEKDGNFYRNRGNKDGLDTFCKVCRKARNAKFKANNPDYQRNYYINVKKPRIERGRSLGQA